MKVLQFPLARITVCFVAGIFMEHHFALNPAQSLLFLALSFIVFCIAFYYSRNNPKQNIFGVAAYALSFCIGIATVAAHNDYYGKDNYIHQVHDADQSHKLEVVLREKIKSSAFNDRYVALVKRIDGKECSGRILVNFKTKALKDTFAIGNNLQIDGAVYKHKKPDNPSQFDYGEYLTNKSVLAQMYANASEVRISKSFDKDAFYYSDKLRNRILKNLKQNHFHQTELNVIAALILGQQQDIDPEIMKDYQFAGAIHILSVSGLHVGFILLFLNFILKYLPKNKTASYLKLAIIIFSLWGFAILAGLSPSVIRSVTMFSFVAVGMHLKRKTNIFHTLLVSMFLILLFEPSFLFDVGFQLSYVALFFILWLQPIFKALWVPKNKITNYFWEILTVSFAAQIGAFPLSVYYFHQFPGLFFVTNMVVIPFLSVIMALGVFVMILAAFNYVPRVLSDLLEWSVFILNKTINWIASFETFIIQNIPFNLAMLWSLYVLIIAIFIWFEKPNFKKMVFALIALMLFQCSYFGSRWICQNQKEWIVFNARKTSLIAERNGEDVIVYTNGIKEKNNLLQSYLTANFCHLPSQLPLQNVAYFNSQKIILIDSLGIYPQHISPDVMVMRQSPKINLDRMLLSCKPKIIIADATNYKSYVQRWKATCRKQKIPFHATAEKGFYKLE
jgi:competence protein ComEC